MLPKAYTVLEKIFESIQNNQQEFENVEFHFIGTGKLPNDAASYNIKPVAEKYSLWQKVVFEYPRRISYLDVLVHLINADGIFILGSTEPHYTPSKVYQGILAGKPILAVLHEKSSAAAIIEEAAAGKILTFDGAGDIASISQNFLISWKQFTNYMASFNPINVNKNAFKKYSAHAVTKELAELLNIIIKQN